MDELYLLRHGRTVAQDNHEVSGSGLDTELTQEGKRQMIQVGEGLRSVSFSSICISPLLRTRQSAEAFLIGYGKPLPIFVVTEMREVHYGEWEGKNKDDYSRIKKQFFLEHPGINGLEIAVGKGAESYEAAAYRFLQALKTLVNKSFQDPILVINHSGNIRSLFLTGKVVVPPDVLAFLREKDFPPGSILVLKNTDQGILYKDFRNVFE